MPKEILQKVVVVENCNHDIITLQSQYLHDTDGFKNTYLIIDAYRKGVRIAHFHLFDGSKNLSIENLGHCLRFTSYLREGYQMLYLDNYGKKITVRLEGKYYCSICGETDSSKRDRVKPE